MRGLFGKIGCYRGHLGCFEEGADTICLHIEGKAQGKTYREFEKKAGDRPFDFMMVWTRKLDQAGILAGRFGQRYLSRVIITLENWMQECRFSAVPGVFGIPD